jgi:hypothetical protein
LRIYCLEPSKQENLVRQEEEQRLVPRRIFDQTVQLERNQFYTGEKSPTLEIGQTLDISTMGLGIKTETPLQPKEMVRVYLPVQTVDIPLPVFSEVRWVELKKNYYRVGLQFVR